MDADIIICVCVMSFKLHCLLPSLKHFHLHHVNKLHLYLMCFLQFFANDFDKFDSI